MSMLQSNNWWGYYKLLHTILLRLFSLASLFCFFYLSYFCRFHPPPIFISSWISHFQPDTLQFALWTFMFSRIYYSVKSSISITATWELFIHNTVPCNWAQCVNGVLREMVRSVPPMLLHHSHTALSCMGWPGRRAAYMKLHACRPHYLGSTFVLHPPIIPCVLVFLLQLPFNA